MCIRDRNNIPLLTGLLFTSAPLHWNLWSQNSTGQFMQEIVNYKLFKQMRALIHVLCKVSCTLLYVPQKQQHWILLLLMLFTFEVQLFVMRLNKQTYKNEKRTMITNLVTALQNILSRSLWWDKRWLFWIPWNEMAFVSTEESCMTSLMHKLKLCITSYQI